MDRKLVLGSRGSRLALWQANDTKARLEAAGWSVGIKVIKTQGDKITDLGFDKLEGKGFFTKEIEAALLNKDIDLAVHSCKDLETTPHPDLVIAAVSDRADPSEWLLMHPSAKDPVQPLGLKADAVVGTSAPRRKMQLLAYQPGLRLKDLRGNVPTRIEKLRKGQYDAICLAAAGIKRLALELDDLEVLPLSPKMMIPAPAQGVLAYQVRKEDTDLIRALEQIGDPSVAQGIHLERQVLNLFQGGCQMPVGVYCEQEGGLYKIWSVMAGEWEQFPKRVYWETDTPDAQAVVKQLKQPLPPSVFISRKLSPLSYLRKTLEQGGVPFHDQSLVSFSPVRVKEIPPADWLFFTSKNGVRYFFEQLPQAWDMPKIGAIGKGTATTLRRYGHDPDFTGEGNDMPQIAASLESLVRGKTILFPRAEHSLRTIQQHLENVAVVKDLIVYRNQPIPDPKIPKMAVLIFTSPMNVEHYVKHYPIVPDQQIIAIGRSTAAALPKQANVTIAYEPGELAIVDTLGALDT